MPTITIRVTGSEKATLEAAASREGLNLSDYVRQSVSLRHNKDVLGSIDELYRRLERLEELANLN